MQLFFVFLLLSNGLAPSRLLPQVQGPGVVKRGFVGKRTVEERESLALLFLFCLQVCTPDSALSVSHSDLGSREVCRGTGVCLLSSSELASLLRTLPPPLLSELPSPTTASAVQAPLSLCSPCLTP